MDIKINGPTDSRLTGPAAGQGAQPAETASSGRADRPAETRPAADRATVSNRARLLQKARAALDAAPDVRADKVDAAREAIAGGRYRVDVRALAARLFRLIAGP